MLLLCRIAQALHATRATGLTIARVVLSFVAGSSASSGRSCLSECHYTTISGGKLIFHVFGALAEFERALIRERTQAGLAAARARGRHGGRPRKLDTPRKVAMARNLYDDERHSIAERCQRLRISRATLYRYIGAAGAAVPKNSMED
jgi:DNA invertase Pin-like site-specific DNA recombinase